LHYYFARNHGINKTMGTETRICQNCKSQFVIEPDDFQFYEKIKVPPPTWCPECRHKRRFMFRNERSLYKHKCVLCGKNIISMYPSASIFPIYCHECWWGDGWNPLSYGIEYNYAKPFMVQFKELLQRVPKLNLFSRNSVNCQYANLVGESKNVYLSYSVIGGSEDVFYSKIIDNAKNIFDSFSVANSEQAYENTASDHNYNCAFLFKSRQCMDSQFLFDCVNCRHCFLSSNLRNKEYVIRNKKYSKENFFQELKKIDLGSYKVFKDLKEQFFNLRRISVHRYANIMKSVGSTGDDLSNTKNARIVFDAHEVENVKYGFRVPTLKDSMDTDFQGISSELIYEYIVGGKNDSLVRFSIAQMENVRDASYSDYCFSSSNIFGCVGLRRREYCILNKQYSKEEYEELVPKIIKHMNDMPYVDKKGRIYKYGEFFPPELSPFCYNETIAQEYFPLTKEQAIEQGYSWKDPEPRNYQITITPDQLPDHIKDVPDSIIEEIIGCAHKEKCNEQCTQAFKIIPDELQFLRKMNLPLPRLCPNCRHYQRLKQRNPLKLWHRKCMCAGKKSETRNEKLGTGYTYENTIAHFHGNDPCLNEFETSYSPERPEIVYCEACYNVEVA